MSGRRRRRRRWYRHLLFLARSRSPVNTMAALVRCPSPSHERALTLKKLLALNLSAFAGAFVAIFVLGLPIGVGAGGAPATDKRFCADSNGDGSLDVADAVNVLNFLFTGSSTPYCIAQDASLDKFATREDLQALQARVESLEASSRTAGLVATGSYAGDGRNGRIIETGLAGKLRAVQLWAKEDNANNSHLSITDKVDTMAGTGCRGTYGLSLNGGNFVVDSTFLLPGSATPYGSTLNQVGLTYEWVAVASPE